MTRFEAFEIAAGPEQQLRWLLSRMNGSHTEEHREAADQLALAEEELLARDEEGKGGE
jgi:hypothetical protein